MTCGNAPPPHQRARSGAVTDERCLSGMTCTTDLGVQCSGEAQLPSSGVSAAPDGQPVLDVIDLDELLLALFEWEVEPQEAPEPVPVPYTGPSEHEHRGQRRAMEQHLAQATDDVPDCTDGKDRDGADGKHSAQREHGTRCCAGEGNDLGHRIADPAAAPTGQNATDHQRLTGAVGDGRQNAALGPPTANPQPPLSGPLLRQGSGGRGRAGAAPAPAREPSPAPAVKPAGWSVGAPLHVRGWPGPGRAGGPAGVRADAVGPGI
jgi:hypothetical protein